MTHQVLAIRGLSVSFGSQRTLADIDMEVAAGSIHALLGPNGAGKTTIFKALLGAVDYAGDITRYPSNIRVGHLIEYPAFYARLTLLDNLALWADYAGASRDQLGDLLTLVGLSEQASVQAGRVSLGMKQRLGIARALIGSPQLVLLDEPTNGLDPIGIRDCRELLCRLRDDLGVAFLLSSHNLTEVAATADRLSFIQSGRILHTADRDDVSGSGLEDMYVSLIGGDRG